MVKFLFARMSEPQFATCNNEQAAWPGSAPVLKGDTAELQAMYAHVWHWQCGDCIRVPSATSDHSPAELLALLAADDEREGIAAAYGIAAHGGEAV